MSIASSTSKLDADGFTMPTSPAAPRVSEEVVKTTQRLRDTLKFEDREKLLLPDVKRKVKVAEFYFYDYYFDQLTYLHGRKLRLQRFKEDVERRGLTLEQRDAEWKDYCGRERSYLRRRRTKVRMDHFHILSQVGQGGYGSVYLARKKDTNEICALKKLDKRALQKMGEVNHVLTERDVLTATRSEWLVKLLYAFQDRDNLFLAMEYVPGGDFRTLLNGCGVLHEQHARFYIAEMFMGVNALHELGYIHRDLKPENFLIDSNGHIKLTDFGLAAGLVSSSKIESMRKRLDEVKDMQLIQRTAAERRSFHKTMRAEDVTYAHSVVGSADYMAFEVASGAEYDFTVDYWSLGCILYEFLADYPPFAGKSSKETWINLQHWNKVLRRPNTKFEDGTVAHMSDEAWDLITKLITWKNTRFKSFAKVQEHAFFTDSSRPASRYLKLQQPSDWDALRNAETPFVPELESETDHGYFDDFDDPKDMAKYKDVMDRKKEIDQHKAGELLNGERSAFVGFTFRHKGLNGVNAAREKMASEESMFDTMF